ncbi:MAG: DUF4249 domain-containing protein [Prevotella sp.]|nr:DUF4249 domain-containing protein [Prevotella sp.]
MMQLSKTLCFVLCLMAGVCTLSGCIEEYEADLSAEDSDLLVVEGTICSAELNKFYLSRSQTINSSYTPQMEMGASVSVRGSDGSEYKAQLTDDCYSCWIGLLDPDIEYWLHIETNGEVYESDPQRPLPTEGIADVCGVQNSSENSIDVLITPDVPFQSDKPNFYSWSYDETWEVYADYTTRLFFDTELEKAVYKPDQFPERGWKDAAGSTITFGTSQSYDGQHIQRLKIYDIDYDNERIFHKYSGLVHQRAITKAEYEYELALQQAGSEMGGLFTPLPTALPTNIRCLTSHKHVIGYVGCSLNTSDYRFFLNASDFSIHRPPKKDERTWFEDTSIADCLQMVEEGKYLCEWQDKRMEPGGKLKTAWATVYQLDVRYKGAYIQKPDFWPSEEDE